jgi:hypothetical protein
MSHLGSSLTPRNRLKFLRAAGLGLRFNLIIAAFVATSFTVLTSVQEGSAQNRSTKNSSVPERVTLTGLVMALNSCELYPAGVQQICQQNTVGVRTTLLLTPLTKSPWLRPILLRTSNFGDLKASLRAGTYQITLKAAFTDQRRFNPRSLQVTPGTITVTQDAAPALLLVSHITRSTADIAIAYGK